MRKSSILLVGIVLGFPTGARAVETPQAIVERAIQAHGGAEKLSKPWTIQTKRKGTLGTFAFVQQASLGPAGQFKEALEVDVNGKKFTLIRVFNGEEGWVISNEKPLEVNDQLRTELREASFLTRVVRLAPLKDKMIELTALGEAQVNGRPAVGVKVSLKGHRDINLYFDKGSGLLAKIERRVVDVTAKQEFNEEQVITEYQETEGIKTVKKAIINRDGKKFVELEVTEVKFLDKIDESEFAKP
jgi:hypothetical protein